MTGARYEFGDSDSEDERRSFVDPTEAGEFIVRGEALLTNLRAFVRLDDRDDQAIREEMRLQGERFVARLRTVLG